MATNKYIKIDNFKPNQIQFEIIVFGPIHPPKKIITINNDISKIFVYSPKKNKANPIDEYSTLNPATNSASASGKSNGALLVSASNDINIIIHNGNIGIQYQIFCCFNTISVKFNVPA